MKRLKLGTRGSPLALKQTDMVRQALLAVDPSIEVEVVEVLTSGDWKPSHGETPLKADAGGKALFAKEIEERLLSGEIDAAVHSMKDMESYLPDGLVIPWMLPREDPRDALIVTDAEARGVSVDDLPIGALVGTTSLRRQAFLLSRRPDLKITPLRGNVQTRVQKIRSGQVDASFLAWAGLKRLGLTDEAAGVIAPEVMLPAAAQGAVGIEILSDRREDLSVFDQISCTHTVSCVLCERSVLQEINGSCHTPVGVYATLENGEMHVRACVLMPDGSARFEEEGSARVSSIEEAVALGRQVGQVLKPRIPEGVL